MDATTPTLEQKVPPALSALLPNLGITMAIPSLLEALLRKK